MKVVVPKYLILMGHLAIALTLCGTSAMGKSRLHTKKKQSANIFGRILVRPSFTPSKDDIHSDNLAELGIRLKTGNVKLSYVQTFETLLGESSTGRNFLVVTEGFTRVRVDNIWTAKRNTHALSYENRIYFPTNRNLIDTGLVASMRNYFKFKRPLSKSVNLEFEEVPIVHAYSKAGYVSSDRLIANPILENRFQYGLAITLNKKWLLRLPLGFYLIKYREFDDSAAKNGALEKVLVMEPEIIFNPAKNVSLGASFITGNFLTNGEGEADSILHDGVSTGTARLFFQLSF